jgi:AraC-like DNA-binding protein
MNPGFSFTLHFKGYNAIKIVYEMLNRYGHIYNFNKEHELIVKMMNWRHFNGLEPHITAGESADAVYSLFTSLINSIDSQREYGKNLVLSKAIDLINKKSNMNINASYIANELGISREHLSRIFRDEIGQAPYQYILRKKILLSCQLLKETDLSIKQICNRIGEESQEVFSRRFKTKMKMTPLEFRKYGIIPIK